MSCEIIGSVTEWEPGWEVDWAYKMAISFLTAALGDPPSGATIEVAWQDHDLGSYPAVAVNWHEGTSEPWEFIHRAEKALLEFNDAIDWHRIRPSHFSPVASAEGEEE